MASNHVERKLAAVFAADVAGYSRLMSADEEGTLARLKALRRELLDPKIEEHDGRIVKTTGDSVLVEFPSVVDAVRCAIEVQRVMGERNVGIPEGEEMAFRIGINLGDVIIDPDDIHGDGVNIAVRLQDFSEPGGISVSEDAFRQVRGKIAAKFVDLGEQNLKNIARAIRVYRVTPVKPTGTGRLRSLIDASVGATRPTLALPDRPSIAVLPFQNMSDDPEQEYFADGMVEEITTALSRMRWLFVIARNSSFTYKGHAVDVKQVARELGVRYVLEGSIRKAETRLRISGQLIDGATGAHLWADRFEGAPEDIFDLTDHVTESVVGAITPKLERAEIARAKRKPTDSLDAYDYYLRGLASLYQWTSREANVDALRLFGQAMARDPEFGSAYAMAAYCYVNRRGSGWMVDRVQEIAETARLGQRAVELGRGDAVALTASGLALAYVVRDLDIGGNLVDRALVLNTNLAMAWLHGGWTKIWRGEPDAAIECLAHARRLSPVDPHMARMHSATATAHFSAGRYDEATSWAAKALQQAPDFLDGLRISAASNALAGHLNEARISLARLRLLDPSQRLSNLNDVQGPYRRSDDLARYAEGLRKAGLRE